ncbi:MAG: hypothetical protein HRT89_20315 [Lentisphaeria bacterium]|nr:hypothetical protein [Lentisphaeria bacterium]NQZ70404.1 hypothetical protein [Lentisphaeria bacterium]
MTVINGSLDKKRENGKKPFNKYLVNEQGSEHRRSKSNYRTMLYLVILNYQVLVPERYGTNIAPFLQERDIDEEPLLF